MTKTISILGSTGSIGKQALEVIDGLQDQFEIYGLAAGDNIEILTHQIERYKPKVVSVKTEKSALELKKLVQSVEVLYGEEGLVEIAGDAQNNMVLMAVSGIAGLKPTLAAIENGVDIALANKETLVAAGSLVMKLAQEKGVRILPVDSEHSAIHQCIKTNTYGEEDFRQVRRLIITASGGPFRNKSIDEIKNATVKETLSHPRWSMGSKITVDSATLMNKGLEVIEAHHLFNVDYKDIKVVIHPQSIIHSAVEYLDGSVVAQMGIPSMHIPIQYALTYPERIEGIKTGSLDFVRMGSLDFEEPDFDRFPCLKLAYGAGIKGGTYPVVLNAVNEEAVYSFLRGEIGLMDIPKIVENTLSSHTSLENPTLSEIIEIDRESRAVYQRMLKPV